MEIRRISDPLRVYGDQNRSLNVSRFLKILENGQAENLDGFMSYLADEKNIYEEDYNSIKKSAAEWQEIWNDFEELINEN